LQAALFIKISLPAKRLFSLLNIKQRFYVIDFESFIKSIKQRLIKNFILLKSLMALYCVNTNLGRWVSPASSHFIYPVIRLR